LKQVVVYALTAPPRDMLSQMMSGWSRAEQEKLRIDAETQRDEFWEGLGPLRSELSPWEREYARSTMLTMTAAQQVDASWRVEAVQVLLWALELCSGLPPYDVAADHDLLKHFPAPDAATFLRSATLRPVETIDRARDMAELWHWRSRTRQLIEEGQPFPESPEMKSIGFRSYDDIVRFTAARAGADGRLTAVQDEDFAAFGKAYRDLNDEEWSCVRSITVERHYTLNWLCGYAPSHQWDETPTDT
jgi:hypothetical protein